VNWFTLLLTAAGKKKKQAQQQLTTSKAPDISAAPEAEKATAAPPLADQQQSAPIPAAAVGAGAGAAAPRQSNWTNIIWKRAIRELSSLPRAIGIMAVITGLSALGTVIPQNKVSSQMPASFPITDTPGHLNLVVQYCSDCRYLAVSGLLLEPLGKLCGQTRLLGGNFPKGLKVRHSQYAQSVVCTISISTCNCRRAVDFAGSQTWPWPCHAHHAMHILQNRICPKAAG